MNTYSGHIWMVDPRLEDEWSNTVYNDNRVIVLFCDGKNKRVSSVPCRQVVSAKKEPCISSHWPQSPSMGRTYRSPSLPSTVIYSSPLSELKNTRAADRLRAMLPARGRLKSSNSHEILVRNSRALR